MDDVLSFSGTENLYHDSALELGLLLKRGAREEWNAISYVRMLLEIDV